MSRTFLGQSSIVRLAPDVVVDAIDGEAVVVNLRTEAVFSLNSTGARIAELIGAGAQIEHIVETLSAEYGHNRGGVEREVLALVRALAVHGLVVTEPGERA